MDKLFQYFDKKIDATGMYRTVSSTLIFLLFCSLTLGAFGFLAYSPLEQLISLVVAVGVAMVATYLMGKIVRIPVNLESAVITALIIFFLVLPAQLSSLADSWIIATVTLLAVLSKFVIVWKQQHLLNPAAAGAVALTIMTAVLPLGTHFESSWWIGTMYMFLPLFIAGLVVVIKIQKWVPVLSFLVVAFIVFLFEEWRFGGELISGSSRFWFSGPSLFLAFFMLTEPFTMPPTKKLQVWYGVLTGALSQIAIFAPWFRMTPELALVLGNLAFFPSTLRRKLIMPFVGSREVAKNTWEFSFEKPVGVHFKAGQYLEWMLPHTAADNRGIRRYFTIASAPQDKFLKIGVRMGESISTYKAALKSIKVGETITASQLSGDFTLPADPKVKVALVAGGIGITPFVSQILDMEERRELRDTILYSCNNTLVESAYRDEFKRAATVLPLSVVEVLAKEEVPGMESGFLTPEIILRTCPDYLERTWYISGPPMMVSSYAAMLVGMKIPATKIKTDFFPGLA